MGKLKVVVYCVFVLMLASCAAGKYGRVAFNSKKIGEYYFRRKGLGIATLLITILVIALYFRIKSIEK